MANHSESQAIHAAPGQGAPVPHRLRDPTEPTRGLHLGRIASVDIRLDWSLFIVVALISVNLGAGLFPLWHPDWGMGLSWTIAIAAALLFIASILVHELAHAVVARSQGIPISRIDLFLFGGLAHLDKEPASPKSEFLMAIVGPLVSIGIGALATAVGIALAGQGLLDLTLDDPAAAMRSIGPVATLLLWLGPVNIAVGLFNMVPGFPLDGGRVLRSLLWAATNNLTKATRWAAATGQAFAWFLMAVGIVNLFAGSLVQGFWLLLIGWFLNNAARTSYTQMLVHHALEDLPVSRVMRTRFVKVPPETKIESLVHEHLMGSDQQAFPVESADALVGLVSINDIRRVPHERWPETSVSQIMTPARDLVVLGQDASAERALEELARRDVDQIPILDGQHVLGLVHRGDLVKWIALQGNAPRMDVQPAT